MTVDSCTCNQHSVLMKTVNVFHFGFPKMFHEWGHKTFLASKCIIFIIILECLLPSYLEANIQVPDSCCVDNVVFYKIAAVYVFRVFNSRIEYGSVGLQTGRPL